MVTIKINTGSAAFEPEEKCEMKEIANILEQVVYHLDRYGLENAEDWKLRDSNGNTVGEFIFRREK